MGGLPIIELKSQTQIDLYLEEHTSQEQVIRNQKCSRQTANAGTLQLPVERWGDVLQLFWMGDF